MSGGFDMSMKIERAAGGLVVRKKEHELEVLMIEDVYGKVTFPKGHLEYDEWWETAAIREVYEETGIESQLVAPLGRIEYVIERNGQPILKQVRLFLLKAVEETDEPEFQQEEIQNAFYLPWDEAKQMQEQRGYENWSWIFAKAQVIWKWHDENWETRWRQLPADTENSEVDAVWREVEPLVHECIQVVKEELIMTLPEIFKEGLYVNGASKKLPKKLSNHPLTDLKQAIELTLLKPDGSLVDVLNVCTGAVKAGFPLVCIYPQFVQEAVQKLQNKPTEVCTVVGFPFGTSTPEILQAEVKTVLAMGAKEIDMVIPFGSVKEDDLQTAYHHVQAVVSATHASDPNCIVKVILESSVLSYDQVIKATFTAFAAGANFVKTSTGFHSIGGRIADVALMSLLTGEGQGVKASGGIHTRAEALQFLRYGATRIGTSKGLFIVGK